MSGESRSDGVIDLMQFDDADAGADGADDGAGEQRQATTKKRAHRGKPPSLIDLTHNSKRKKQHAAHEAEISVIDLTLVTETSSDGEESAAKESPCSSNAQVARKLQIEADRAFALALDQQFRDDHQMPALPAQTAPRAQEDGAAAEQTGEPQAVSGLHSDNDFELVSFVAKRLDLMLNQLSGGVMKSLSLGSKVRKMTNLRPLARERLFSLIQWRNRLIHFNGCNTLAEAGTTREEFRSTFRAVEHELMFLLQGQRT